jgi:predicted small secreted protein
MPRIAIGARQTPVKTQTVFTALLISAALALSACDTVASDGPGEGAEASGEPDRKSVV